MCFPVYEDMVSSQTGTYYHAQGGNHEQWQKPMCFGSHLDDSDQPFKIRYLMPGARGFISFWFFCGVLSSHIC